MARKPTTGRPKKSKGSGRAGKKIETLTHGAARRKNIPTAEMQSLAERVEETAPVKPVTYERTHPLNKGERRPRDPDLDPQIIWQGTKLTLTPAQIKALKNGEDIELSAAQLVWRGKDEQDWSDLVVAAPPIYVQEKIHPRQLIADLQQQTKAHRAAETTAPDMFDNYKDFNGLAPDARTEFYQHDQNWQNRMILGDSLQVMASLAEREGLRGKVQCIYMDPPYGIKFNSNWQVSTRSRDVKDGKADQITREPEQVKAFRDTWKDGIHSYLTYLRDRLTVMRDLLTESGSIFVQIGDENVHRVRALMDEIFGEENYQNLIYFATTGGLANNGLSRFGDYVLWYSRDSDQRKFRQLYEEKKGANDAGSAYKNIEVRDGERRRLSKNEVDDPSLIPEKARVYRISDLCGQGVAKEPTPFSFEGIEYHPTKSSHWKPRYPEGLERLSKAKRLYGTGKTLNYLRFFDDYPVSQLKNVWLDTGHSGFSYDKLYVVQTSTEIAQRCILMATDPGDLVLDPTCGSGTTATVAEQWGRRWCTMDTSRVALALARSRLMGARYPYYLLADSAEGRWKEAEITGKIQPDTPPPETADSDAPRQGDTRQGNTPQSEARQGDIRQGFVYQRTAHIMLKTIANNAEIDVIWDKWQQTLEPLRQQLNTALGTDWQEWQIPREIPAPGEASGAAKADWSEATWSEAARVLHAKWWEARIKRQQEIDTSIANKAEVEMLYDRPYEDSSRVRVAGPFTVESLSPHRVIPADEGELAEEWAPKPTNGRTSTGQGSTGQDFIGQDFASTILQNLKSAGLHQSEKQDRLEFTTMQGWCGEYIAATATYEQAGHAKRAAVFIGPEFGTITRAHLMAAVREAVDAGFDVLIACGFNFDAHSSSVEKLGEFPVLKAKINPDLHMAGELKNTGAGNLFVVFGEPDIKWHFDGDGKIVVELLGVDVFDPKTGEVRASGKDDIAAWFIDTNYNEESFFVRTACFMGANDPYKQLKTSLKAEIDAEAWATLYRDKSRPFPRPETGRFAVKVINHFGDEVMKVFKV